MKKIYILMIAVLLGGIAKGQWQNQPSKPNAQDIINKSLSGKLPQSHFPEQIKSLKASNSISWNFDTIVTFYDNNNLKQRITQTFDVNGNVLTNKKEDRQNNTWVNYHKITYTYDANGNKLTDLFEQWQNNAWVNYSRNTYIYDANGNMLTYLTENKQSNIWVNYSRYTYTYDVNENKLTDLIELWQNNAWINGSKYTYSYDINGNKLTYFSETWQNNAWVNNVNGTYTLDTNGNMIIDFFEVWQNNTWVNGGKYTNTYDANGNKLTNTYEYWQNNAWLNNNKNTYIYDANGNLITLKSEYWLNNEWVNYYKHTYTYDSEGNSITGKFEGWYNYWILSINDLDVYYSKTSIFSLYDIARYEAHFVSFTNGINETTPKQLNLFPNPATNTLTLNLSQQQGLQNATVSIYDIQGKQLLQQTISQSQTQIDISSFAKGIYIVKLQTDKECLQSKFVKE